MPNLAKERERGRRRRRDAKIVRLEAKVAELTVTHTMEQTVPLDLTDPAATIAAWCAATW